MSGGFGQRKAYTSKYRRVYFPNGTSRLESTAWINEHRYDIVFKTVPFPPPKAKPKAFANPNSFGYGGGETPWPFDRKRAYTDGRYRAGIRNAIHADWTASNWKAAARSSLIQVLEDLIAAEEVFLQD